MTERVVRKIAVAKLEVGMNVVRLDRPWLETDFLLQGFVIQNQQELAALQTQCDFVYIEGEVMEGKPYERHHGRQKGFVRSAIPPKKVKYINKVAFDDELPKASMSFVKARHFARSIIHGVRIGRALDLEQAKVVVEECVDSILRNPNTLLWLTQIKNQDEYTAEHSMNVCILSAYFARHLGLDEHEIQVVGLCGLLHDIGKAKIPEEILNKPGRLSKEEYELIKEHPTLGRNMLIANGVDHLAAIDVAYMHHERVDGKGYPRQLTADQIPLYAKIVGLADCYDAITSKRCYDQERSSMEALTIIREGAGSQFDEELAHEFINCIGIYPPGTLVEMTNGEVGLVMASNPENRLTPQMLIVMDRNKQCHKQIEVDLSLGVKDEWGDLYQISKELPNGAFDINIKHYLHRLKKSTFAIAPKAANG